MGRGNLQGRFRRRNLRYNFHNCRCGRDEGWLTFWNTTDQKRIVQDVFQTDNTGENVISQTVKYWLEFFEELDTLVQQIKEEDLINIAELDSDW